jgi:hypothetical protein
VTTQSALLTTQATGMRAINIVDGSPSFEGNTGRVWWVLWRCELMASLWSIRKQVKRGGR